MKTILCYGDSNTWGFVPCIENLQSNAKKRYPRHIRWPGRLQDLLGKAYYVIEEGLNSRTTNIDYHVPPDRNGATYLPACLYSHAPLDLVILALGGNDLKTYFNRSVEDVCQGMRALIDMIKTSHYGPDMQAAPKILLLSQIIPHPIAETFKDDKGDFIFDNLILKAEALTTAYENLAKATGCYFLDVSKEIKPSPIDGVHLDEQAHQRCAELLEKYILKIH